MSKIKTQMKVAQKKSVQSLTRVTYGHVKSMMRKLNISDKEMVVILTKVIEWLS